MFSNRNWPSFNVVLKGEKFESFASVILRVPGLMLIDQWSHSSERSWPQTSDITDKCYAFIFNLSNLRLMFTNLDCRVTGQILFISRSADSGSCHTHLTVTEIGYAVHALPERSRFNWCFAPFQALCSYRVSRCRSRFNFLQIGNNFCFPTCDSTSIHYQF